MDEEQASDSAGVWGADNSTEKNTFGSPANDADGKCIVSSRTFSIIRSLMIFSCRRMGKLCSWKHVAA